MKTFSRALAIVVLLVLGGEGLALAQPWGRLPPGSYRQTCSKINFDGRTLTARCLDVRGRSVRTSLANPHRCRRDIANINGTLMCR
jgi:hypothetical protein